MEGIKYVYLIEIGLVVIEIQVVENYEVVVSVNNILVCHSAFLATDTRPCVLISRELNCFVLIKCIRISFKN